MDGVMFRASHDESPDFFAEIDEVVGVSHGGHSATDAFQRFGDDVLVFHRNEGNGDSHHFPDLRRPDPRCIDDDLCLDAPLFCPDLIDGSPLA
jgi:hypothetical protein